MEHPGYDICKHMGYEQQNTNADYTMTELHELLLEHEGLHRKLPEEIGQVQSPAPWQLARLTSAKHQAVGNEFEYNRDGSGVQVYIVDSGVEEDHPEFYDAPKMEHWNATEDDEGEYCENLEFEDIDASHGTMVASQVIGKTLGVAKKASLISVRITNCENQTMSYHDHIVAFERIRNSIIANNKPAVVQVSALPKDIEGDAGFRKAINDLYNQTEALIVFSAGNKSTNRDCRLFPDLYSKIFVVAAIKSPSAFAGFSSHGDCIDLLAPGKSNKVALPGNPGSYDYKEGTSIAAPLVSGAAALYLQSNPDASREELAARIKEDALTGAVSAVPSDTANSLLHTSKPSLLSQSKWCPTNKGTKYSHFVSEKKYRPVVEYQSNPIFYANHYVCASVPKGMTVKIELRYNCDCEPDTGWKTIKTITVNGSGESEVMDFQKWGAQGRGEHLIRIQGIEGSGNVELWHEHS